MRRRHVANYLLDKRLQLTYVGLVTVLSGALAAVLGAMVWAQERQASTGIIDTLDATDFGPELKTTIVEQLGRTDTSLVLLMVGVWIAMVVLLTGYLIVMTHRVAGPLYKVSSYFEDMATGRLRPVYPLRRGDHFQAFYDTFKQAHDAVRERHQRELEALGRYLAACEQAGLADDERLALAAGRALFAKRRQQLG
jgi:hypothetical protein